MWRLWGSDKKDDSGAAGADGPSQAEIEDAALIELKKLIWDLLEKGDAPNPEAGPASGEEKTKPELDTGEKTKPDEMEPSAKQKLEEEQLKDGDPKNPKEKLATIDPSFGSWRGSSRRDGPELEVPSEATMRRFLRGLAQQDPKVAAERIRKYIEWRASSSYGLDHPIREINIDTPGIREQLASGKCYLLKNKDKAGRPVCVVHVRRHNPAAQSKDELTRFGVYMLETAESMLPTNSADPEKEKLLIVFDLEAVAMANIDYSAAKRIIYMLTYFYPERMGMTLLLSAPTLFSVAWPVIRPWLHPNTQQKVHFVNKTELSRFIDPAALPTVWGGEDTTEYFKAG